MKKTGIAIAVLLPALVAGLSLAAVTANRASGRAPMVLSEREVTIAADDADNTFRVAGLSWHSAPGWPDTWFDRDKLAAIGFDTSVDPSSRAADAHYRRMLPRDAFVAFELDGPAFQALLARPEFEDVAPPGRRPGGENDFREWGSRLVAVDAASDGEVLAARYPDGRTHMVTAAVVSIRRIQRPGQAPYLAGAVNNVRPNRIHVPREWASALPRGRGEPRARFTVSVRYGARFEPWVVGAAAR